MGSTINHNYGRRHISADAHSGGADAFARLRVSSPLLLFESKALFNKQPLQWDEAATGGASAAVHTSADASVTLTVAGNGEKVIRQTFEHFNSQPGSSQLVMMTGVLGAAVTDVRRCLGAFTATDGFFFELQNAVLSVIIRKDSTDTRITQADWNLDKMDGTGASRITIDVSKAQLFIVDFGMSIGRIRFGFIVEGEPIYVHQHLTANVLTATARSSPNHPLRWEISSTGGSASLLQIGETVLAEGSSGEKGISRYRSTGGTHIDANDADTLYAVIGIQLKAAALDGAVRVHGITMIAETNDDFEWQLILNPTVAGTFTYADLTNSFVQTALGATANTITGGTVLDGGFAQSDAHIDVEVNNTLHLGSSIAAVTDTMVLCVRPLSANANIQASLAWRELQ